MIEDEDRVLLIDIGTHDEVYLPSPEYPAAHRRPHRRPSYGGASATCCRDERQGELRRNSALIPRSSLRAASLTGPPPIFLPSTSNLAPQTAPEALIGVPNLPRETYNLMDVPKVINLKRKRRNSQALT